MNELYKRLLLKLENSFKALPDKSEETAENTLRALWLAASGTLVAVTLAHQHELTPLSNSEIFSLESLIEKRLKGTPLAHLTMRQEFLGVEFLSDPRALIPRKETEILGNICIDAIKKVNEQIAIPRVIDVCTGSGNLAIAFAHYAPQARIWAADLSDEAVSLAQANARHTHVEERVAFVSGDFLEPFKNDSHLKKTHILCCNPPYISSAVVQKMDNEIHDHEPDMAFDGGPFGIKILARLIKEAPLFLVPNGYLCFEVGLGQGPAMIKRLKKTEIFHDIIGAKDKDGNLRAIRARYKDKILNTETTLL